MGGGGAAGGDAFVTKALRRNYIVLWSYFVTIVLVRILFPPAANRATTYQKDNDKVTK